MWRSCQTRLRSLRSCPIRRHRAGAGGCLERIGRHVREHGLYGPALALLLAGASLRVWGIKQGLPYSYNSDEQAISFPGRSRSSA